MTFIISPVLEILEGNEYLLRDRFKEKLKKIGEKNTKCHYICLNHVLIICLIFVLIRLIMS